MIDLAPMTAVRVDPSKLLCPIAPFITEEVWQEALGHKGHSVHQVPWPDYDEALAKAEVITVMVQVNGKLRDRVTVPRHRRARIAGNRISPGKSAKVRE